MHFVVLNNNVKHLTNPFEAEMMANVTLVITSVTLGITDVTLGITNVNSAYTDVKEALTSVTSVHTSVTSALPNVTLGITNVTLGTTSVTFGITSVTEVNLSNINVKTRENLRKAFFTKSITYLHKAIAYRYLACNNFAEALSAMPLCYTLSD